MGQIFRMQVVTAGILTSGLTPLCIRSMRTGPRHWRARGHREITWSFTKVFFKFPKCFVSRLLQCFFLVLWISNEYLWWYLWVDSTFCCCFSSSQISCAAIRRYSHFTTSWTLRIVYGFIYKDNYGACICLWFSTGLTVFRDIYDHGRWRQGICGLFWGWKFAEIASFAFALSNNGYGTVSCYIAASHSANGCSIRNGAS